MSQSNDNGSDNQSENSQPKGRADHLKPHWFKPGKSGNPLGRPKRKTITEAIFDELVKEVPKEILDKMPHLKGVTQLEFIATVAVTKAMKGDFKFMKEIIDRVDGKVPWKAEISGPDKGPIEFNLKALQDEELFSLERIVAKATARFGEDQEGVGESPTP